MTTLPKATLWEFLLLLARPHTLSLPALVREREVSIISEPREDISASSLGFAMPRFVFMPHTHPTMNLPMMDWKAQTPIASLSDSTSAYTVRSYLHRVCLCM
ncbi:hypothetical protein BU24DRAFT_68688 [Aaosphaeria arxii CBS 175.79]|uniref:Secreted protein n=1 Tax=Aaosphaeria arxii CBS 175.79 TaxID=1450172 RepID=A0A6A5XB18_9PLEO|nr:uncharacterized protein BU24DRAFT_68688 [Aaosphaeria arxii CBS 175.79]KAF2009974.1 hypothetical protein BU24DRAFT_68688 [Aaosphaeria arxii CBS 175.79]